MAISKVSGIKITGVCSVLPAAYQSNFDLSGIPPQDLEKIIASTGISGRRLSGGETALSMAVKGASDLIKNLDWPPSSIGLVIFVTQTPDFQLPGNAVQVQHKLNLAKTTACFDINLGCSGFVYGLWQAAALLNSIDSERALLIVGDTTSNQFPQTDKKVAPLFGDGVSIIGLQKKPSAAKMTFHLGTDGAGAPYLIQPNGGALNTNKTLSLFMDGTQVFAFTLREVPVSIRECMASHGWKIDDLDFVLLHQANRMMIERVGLKIGSTKPQLPIDLKEIGNTSSASIPMILTRTLASRVSNNESKLLASGFGVGWSWASVALSLPKLEYCQTIDYRN
ncbi:3-oxoacyl-acyl-carrier-protein synthase 3 [Rhodobacteraceae bacterium SB2]|nr:3-oxoacyl-acyl-carrier-protein synthase 3 [Rhodobacteraceae bacterium SB2]